MTFVEFNIYSYCCTQAKILIIFKTMTKLIFHIKIFKQMYTIIVVVTVNIQLETIENTLNNNAWLRLQVRK